MLSSLDEQWPIMAVLYSNAILAAETLRIERLKVEAARLHDPARYGQLTVIIHPGRPATVASHLA